MEPLRKETGASVADWGERFGVVGQTARNYETGKSDPPASYILAVAEAEGVNPLWILLGPDEGDLALLSEAEQRQVLMRAVARGAPAAKVRAILDRLDELS